MAEQTQQTTTPATTQQPATQQPTQQQAPARTAVDLFCSLIPGANASSLPVTTGFTVLSAVGELPPHHGVRRR